MASANETTKQESSAVKGRGPSYPILGLRAALERVEKLFNAEGRSLVHTSVAVGLWGYSEKSSGGRQLIATLLQYGLLRDEGSGEQRSIAASTLALEILLHEEGSPERFKALRTAGRSPKLFADILTTYAGTGLPSDASLKRFLIMERNLSADSADTVIKNFRDMLAYSKMLESEQPKAHDESAPGTLKADIQKPEIGDLIQWESGGMLQFEQPRRIRAITEADGASWVFVEGSTTGISMNETSVIERPTKPQVGAPTLAELVPLAQPSLAGEREWLRGPLSKEASYRLFITGDLASKELGKLIKLLQAQKDVLEDDDNEES